MNRWSAAGVAAFPVINFGNSSMMLSRYWNIDEFPELITGKVATPAADHLFNVRNADKAKYLAEEKAIAFHHTTAQLLFLRSLERRDIHTAVSFLTTRVKKLEKRRLGKTQKSVEIPKWNNKDETNSYNRVHGGHQMVH